MKQLIILLATACAAIAQQSNSSVVLTPQSSFTAFCVIYSDLCQQMNYSSAVDMIGVQFPSVSGATEYDYEVTAIDPVSHSLLMVQGVIRASSNDGPVINTMLSMGRAFDPSSMQATVKAMGVIVAMGSNQATGPSLRKNGLR